MVLPNGYLFLLDIFLKPPEEGFKSMPFFRNEPRNIMIIIRNTCIPASIYDNFAR